MIRIKTYNLPVLLITLGLVLANSITVKAQNTLESINQSLRYSRYSRIAPKIIPVREADRRFKLQMVVEKIEEDPKLEDYDFSYSIVNSFKEEISSEKINVLSEENIKRNTDRHFYFEEIIEIPEDQEEAYAVLQVKDKRQDDLYIYHTDLISPFVFDAPDFGAYFDNSIPFDQTYLNMEEALLFKSNAGVNLYSFYYPNEFPVPLPPMETRQPAVPKDLEVVDEGSFLTNVAKPFDSEGYYFIQSDTNSNSGLLIKSTPAAYPKVATWEDMINMVTFISTRKEHEMLQEAENKKNALDQYWINITKDEQLAKDLIREYFRQIEFANILFTDYKEGWATDRGMIYVVMGPPMEVYFAKDREIWIYDGENVNSKITFTFARIKNILTPNFYQLNRSRAYQPEWFKNISAWRSGRMAF